MLQAAQLKACTGNVLSILLRILAGKEADEIDRSN